VKEKVGYYREKLAADRLKRCYDIAPPRVKQYLEAEIAHVLEKIQYRFTVLELGCGYGRVLARIAPFARFTAGIDTSFTSLLRCKETMKHMSDCALLKMNALCTGLQNNTFDMIVCVQNGISAFHVNQRKLIRESIRITKPGGLILFSSYTDAFWPERLEWFKIQADAGLIGEIDIKATHDGIIVSKDGFTARTVRPHDFQNLISDLDVDYDISIVDDSSVFCEIRPH
jgi:SAM-dependent methyltransferase